MRCAYLTTERFEVPVVVSGHSKPRPARPTVKLLLRASHLLATAFAHTVSDMQLLDALREYFRANNFGEQGGYDSSTLTVRVLDRIPVTIPNTVARKRAVFLHDVHHIVTGYDTSFRGECEIAAFELGAGMGPYLAGWAYNAMAFAAGMWLYPLRMGRAFVRGASALPLYRAGTFDADALMLDSVENVRARILAPHDARSSLAWLKYIGLLAVALVGWMVAPLSVVILALAIVLPPSPRLVRVPSLLCSASRV